MAIDERPLLSIIIPTVGRPTLERTLRSLRLQGPLCPCPHEIILVGDTHAGTWTSGLETIPSLLHRLEHPPNLRYVEHDGGRHAWGHPQRNVGATMARGHYLWWLGDDDVALPGALEAIWRAVNPSMDDRLDGPRVHLFRWIAPWKQVLWHTAGFLGDAPGHIDAECIVCPNVPDRLGVWNAARYQGDYDFITETIEKWGGLERVIWQAELIAQAQPARSEDWTQGGCEVTPLQGDAVRPVTVLVPAFREDGEGQRWAVG